MNEIKDKMFQYYNGQETVEDTNLISAKEADDLWNKYFVEAREKLREGLEVQMVIWKDCSTATSYHTEEKAIDYYDCVVEKNSIYKKVLIN